MIASHILTGGRKSGKTMLMQRAMRDHVRANPAAVICELGPGGVVRVEKPVTAADLVPEPMIVFGAFHSACYHESAEALVSLHTTKAGAWRAKHALMWAVEVEAREFDLANGCLWRGHKPLKNHSFSVRVIEVLP